MIPEVELAMLSGERFTIVYHISGNKGQVEQRAQQICIEQTVEFPEELIGNDDIRQHIFGQLESSKQLNEQLWEISISYAYEITGLTLPQTINVIFGNISLQEGICVHKLCLPDSFTAQFKGPRFGKSGLLLLCNETEGPLFCSALKPMGLSSTQLAQQAYEFAKGGIHFIKDDHGICNQPFSRFRERVPLCIEAVKQANKETGLCCRYIPTINAPVEQLITDARWAKAQGAGGLLVPPGIIGMDMMRYLADDNTIALPILCHPAFWGSFTTSVHSGISHYALYGQFARLAGADITIYPNFGGRFSFTLEQCQSIVAGANSDMGHIKTIFPSPGGGMNFNNIPKMVRLYGKDIIFLIGGALHAKDKKIQENCRELRQIVNTAIKQYCAL